MSSFVLAPVEAAGVLRIHQDFSEVLAVEQIRPRLKVQMLCPTDHPATGASPWLQSPF